MSLTDIAAAALNGFQFWDVWCTSLKCFYIYSSTFQHWVTLFYSWLFCPAVCFRLIDRCMRSGLHYNLWGRMLTIYEEDIEYEEMFFGPWSIREILHLLSSAFIYFFVFLGVIKIVCKNKNNRDNTFVSLSFQNHFRAKGPAVLNNAFTLLYLLIFNNKLDNKW